ncbi:MULTISPECIES: hypothetical protein [Spongiibacter]|uniref:hypothetical protein n=1 Tax=Spongiibacter TaxID=630749 RepID=UPI001B2D6E8D|nr:MULTISPECIES: hypothetical protein [Spongiibacter]MBO6752788.1 hypothetical protein [Spongiibacter sp.]|tara:strand:- start:7800 stop:8213 length:414 start_codon:yes stop_codon:yes gene_type:complete
MAAYSELTLTWHPPENAGGEASLGVEIGGQSLIERVSAQLAESDLGLRFLPHSDVAWYSLESWRQSAEDGQSRRIILLGCTCGDVDCAQLWADTRCFNGWVHWRLGGWPDSEERYAELSRWVFEQQAYQAQLAFLSR